MLAVALAVERGPLSRTMFASGGLGFLFAVEAGIGGSRRYGEARDTRFDLAEHLGHLGDALAGNVLKRAGFEDRDQAGVDERLVGGGSVMSADMTASARSMMLWVAASVSCTTAASSLRAAGICTRCNSLARRAAISLRSAPDIVGDVLQLPDARWCGASDRSRASNRPSPRRAP